MLRTTHKQTKREILLPKCLLNALKPEKIRIMFKPFNISKYDKMYGSQGSWNSFVSNII